MARPSTKRVFAKSSTITWNTMWTAFAYWAALAGTAPSVMGPPRRPLRMLGAEDRAKLEAILDEVGAKTG
jgi:hypothetical protein